MTFRTHSLCIYSKIYGRGGQNEDLIWDSCITQNRIAKFMPCKRYVESLCFSTIISTILRKLHAKIAKYLLNIGHFF